MDAAYFRELTDSYREPTMSFMELHDLVLKKIHLVALKGKSSIRLGKWENGHYCKDLLPHFRKYHDKFIAEFENLGFRVDYEYVFRENRPDVDFYTLMW